MQYLGHFGSLEELLAWPWLAGWRLAGWLLAGWLLAGQPLPTVTTKQIFLCPELVFMYAISEYYYVNTFGRCCLCAL